MSTSTQFAGGGIKSIQRGVMLTTSNNTNITVTAVNTAKATLNMLGWNGASTALDTGGYPTIRLSSATNISISQPSFYAVNVSWELVEYF